MASDSSSDSSSSSSSSSSDSDSEVRPGLPAQGLCTPPAQLGLAGKRVGTFFHFIPRNRNTRAPPEGWVHVYMEIASRRKWGLSGEGLPLTAALG